MCRVERAIWLSSGQKVDCVPDWMTVWLSLGPESCKVEPSLGGVSLDVGGAGLRSGGRSTSALGEEPWVLVAQLAEATWCRLRRKETKWGL